MKGKLTPKESFFLYGIWIVAAFGLFILGLYWGSRQATGAGQEITTQPVVSTPAAASRIAPKTRLELAVKDPAPATADTQSGSPVSSPAAGDPKPNVTASTAAAPGAAVPTSPKATPPATPEGKEIFSIQVGALKTEEEARKLIVRLEARGYAGILDKPVSQKDPFYRVRVGRYATRLDAERAEALLKDQGFLTFIKKTK